MKKAFVILTLILGQSILHGQVDTSLTKFKRNTIYLEAFGQGIINSLSFDRLYHIDRKVKTSICGGLMLDPSNLRWGIPISYNWLFGKKKSHLELGVGLTYWTEKWGGSSSDRDTYIYFTPKIGYRFQRPNGGLFFRIAFTPPIGLIHSAKWDNKIWYYNFENPIDGLIFPWGGISLGYTF